MYISDLTATSVILEDATDCKSAIDSKFELPADRK